MRKKRLMIAIDCIILVGIAVIVFFSQQGKKPYKDLDAAQIVSAKVLLTPPDKTIEIETVKVKQYDKRLAIEALNKMLGYNAAEKINHSGGVEVTEKRMTFSDGSTRDENGNIIALPPALQPTD